MFPQFLFQTKPKMGDNLKQLETKIENKYKMIFGLLHRSPNFPRLDEKLLQLEALISEIPSNNLQLKQKWEQKFEELYLEFTEIVGTVNFDQVSIADSLSTSHLLKNCFVPTEVIIINIIFIRKCSIT